MKMRAHKHQARLSGVAQYTPRKGSLEINVSAITARGGGPKKKRKSKKGSGSDFDSDGNPEEGYLNTARGYAHVAAVACGEHHVAVVHQSGELYTWGFGAAGRLGLDGYASAVRSWSVNPSVRQSDRRTREKQRRGMDGWMDGWMDGSNQTCTWRSLCLPSGRKKASTE